jgi:hypothetical protein
VTSFYLVPKNLGWNANFIINLLRVSITVVALNKEEILQWANRYDKEFPYWTKTEKELGDKLRASKELTKPELLKIVEWKFNNQIWLSKRLKSASLNDDEIVRAISRNVFNSPDDYFRMNNLQRLDGVGGAVASTILTFYDPKTYGVFDRHVWREFFGAFSKSQYLWTTENYLEKLLPELTKIAEAYELDVRTVEKAYFTRRLLTKR